MSLSVGFLSQGESTTTSCVSNIRRINNLEKTSDYVHAPTEADQLLKG